MVSVLLARRAGTGGLRTVAAAVLLLIPIGCETDQVPTQAAQSVPPPNSTPTSWLPADVEGDWRGWSFPTGTVGYPVLLTLGFEGLGTDPEDLALTQYNFQSSTGWSTIYYLPLLTEYTLRFEPDGRMQLDTVMLTSNGAGGLLEERIWKDLQMSADGKLLAGTENITLTSWLGGTMSQTYLSFWLTLERLD
jgi:hypothetical protein